MLCKYTLNWYIYWGANKSISRRSSVYLIFNATIIKFFKTKIKFYSSDIIKKSVNAIDDNIVFVGSGSTAAIHKLIGILNITEPPVICFLFFFS